MSLYKKIPEAILTKEERIALPLRELYDSYGYMPFKMSKFEPYELYLENRSFITGDSILTFTDIGGRLKALKPDVTLSILKNYKGGQQKLRYHENVYREGDGRHEFAEIPQVGLECIGEIDLYTQCEVLELAKKSLGLLSDSDDCILDVASVNLVRSLLDATRAGAEVKEKLLTFVREKNLHELGMLCEEQKLAENLQNAWKLLAGSYGTLREAFAPLRALEVSPEFDEALEELQALCSVPGIAEGLNLDFSIVSDLDYYTGLVFKGYIRGVHTPVLSGGRYDCLLWKFGGKGGALGFAVYLDRLQEKTPLEKREQPPITLSYGEGDDTGEIFAKAAALRAKGERVLVCKERDDEKTTGGSRR